MNNRSSILVFAIAFAGCLAVAVCAAVGIGGYWLANNPASVTGLMAPAVRNQIVYVGNDSNIYVADPDTGNKTALTQDAGDAHTYNYPTWSPDDQRIAFVGYSFQNGSPTDGALYTISPRGEKLTPLFKTDKNFPFYLYWSPDSQYVSFLSNQDTNTMALRVAHSDQTDSTQDVDTGAPFYWAWSPDGAKLFTHVGGTREDNENARLAVLNLQDHQAPQTLQALPGAFQAPQWSHDGKLLFSTQDGETQAISLTDTHGSAPTKLANYKGRASFALAPDGKHVAYLVTEANVRVPHFGPLRVIDADGQNERLVSTENALAFQWSPDGKKIAFLTITVSNNQQNMETRPPQLASRAPKPFTTAPLTDQNGQTQLQFNWKIWDSAADQTHLAASFVPTRSFLNVLPYFDQYTNSSTFWSPDSQALVYTTFETADSGSIYIADTNGQAPVKKIGDGVLAFWSWK